MLLGNSDDSSSSDRTGHRHIMTPPLTPTEPDFIETNAQVGDVDEHGHYAHQFSLADLQPIVASMSSVINLAVERHSRRLLAWARMFWLLREENAKKIWLEGAIRGLRLQKIRDDQKEATCVQHRIVSAGKRFVKNVSTRSSELAELSKNLFNSFVLRRITPHCVAFRLRDMLDQFCQDVTRVSALYYASFDAAEAAMRTTVTRRTRPRTQAPPQSAFASASSSSSSSSIGWLADDDFADVRRELLNIR